MIATRSFDEKVEGIINLVDHAEERIKNGMKAYVALERLRKDPNDQGARLQFDETGKDLGYGLLLKRYRSNINQASSEEIKKAALDTVPKVAPLFWSFRIMVGLGFYFILLFGAAFYFASINQFSNRRWFLKVCLWSLPLPWLAAELGWFVAEYGRQPWTIDGILPTFLSASSIPATHVASTLTAFVLFYSVLAVVDVTLMRKYIKLGPDGALKSKKGA